MKRFLFLFSLIFATFFSIAQTYHPDDKEGLKIFLRQNGNFQKLGLEINDTLNWKTSETWVSKIPGLLWNSSAPKRLTHVGNRMDWWAIGISGVLDCSKWEELRLINVSYNYISSLVINTNQNLTHLYCDRNELTFLDISSNYNLTNLDCAENQISELNLSNNTLLTILYCGHNKLTHLDIRNNKLLTYLDCYTNKLTDLDVSYCSHLQWLICENNQLPALNVVNCSELLSLNCLNNNLTHLDVSKSPLLLELICSSNKLSTLNISNNPNLKWLDCVGNKLTSLDVSNSLELGVLLCENNLLPILDVSTNQNLMVLSCSNNQITSLHLDRNYMLGELYCQNNQLTTLELSNSSDVVWLRCAYNQLLFSKIPKPKTQYVYSPQRTIFGGKIDYEIGVDLSEEYNINGNITQFSWFDITNGDEEPVELNGENGFFSLTEDFEHKHLRCKMTNAEFPLLSGANILVYEIYIGSCESVSNLSSEKINNNTILLKWTKPETSLQVEGYHVFRNNLLQNSVLLTDMVYLDENLPNGAYAYYVVAHYTNGCVADSSNHVKVEIDLGVEGVKELGGVMVWPNPAFTTVTIEVENFSKVEIYNAMGQLLQTAQNKVVDVSLYHAGVYFFRVFDMEGNNVTKQVAVVR